MQVYTDIDVYQNTDIMMGVKYLTEKAELLGKPLVIIIGLGTNLGAHDGTAILEEYLIEIAKRRGNVVVVAAGDEANTGHHYRGEFRNDEASKDIELYVPDNEEGLIMLIWSNRPDIISIAITSPTGEYIKKISPRLVVNKTYELILEKTKIFVAYSVTERRTGDQVIFVSFTKPTEGVWTITVFGDLIVDGRFDIWLSRSGWINEETRFLQPDPFTTVTPPSTSISLITSGAYNHQMDSIYIDSGRGLTRDDEQKPDIVAPGVNVYGPLPGNTFGTMTGTSISAAITGGASALLLEWGIVLGKDTEMDTQKVKNYLKRGATRRANISYPNRVWGFGELNLLGTFEAIRGSKT